MSRKIQNISNKVSNQPNAWTHNSKENELKSTGACGESMRLYLENTSIHGLKYIGITTITIFER